MRPAHRWLLAGWLSSLVPALPAFAQADDPAAPVADVKDLSLEELLDTAVEVATRTAVSARETPAVVTVLSREEIVGSGARDLIDLLELVPGFFLGVDVEGAVGIGLRGNWGHEGKVLLLIDGQEQNELLYATLQLGHELPVDQVERIEIIRGPGSATYGGFAELGVINVVTRGASLGGMWVGGRLGAMPTALGGRSLGFQLGQRFREANDLAISVSGSIAASPRSDRVYRDVYGADLPLADRSELGGDDAQPLRRVPGADAALPVRRLPARLAGRVRRDPRRARGDALPLALLRGELHPRARPRALDHAAAAVQAAEPRGRSRTRAPSCSTGRPRSGSSAG